MSIWSLITTIQNLSITGKVCIMTKWRATFQRQSDAGSWEHLRHLATLIRKFPFIIKHCTLSITSWNVSFIIIIRRLTPSHSTFFPSSAVTSHPAKQRGKTREEHTLPSPNPHTHTYTHNDYVIRCFTWFISMVRFGVSSLKCRCAGRDLWSEGPACSCRLTLDMFFGHMNYTLLDMGHIQLT